MHVDATFVGNDGGIVTQCRWKLSERRLLNVSARNRSDCPSASRMGNRHRIANDETGVDQRDRTDQTHWHNRQRLDRCLPALTSPHPHRERSVVRFTVNCFSIPGSSDGVRIVTRTVAPETETVDRDCQAFGMGSDVAATEVDWFAWRAAAAAALSEKINVSPSNAA
jgi:hypothetical protein